jgi:hypothetical protein
MAGAIVGFALPAAHNRELIRNILDMAQLGLIVGLFVASATWVGAQLAGG